MALAQSEPCRYLIHHDFCYDHNRFRTQPQRSPVGADGYHYDYHYDYDHVCRIATD